MVEVTEKTQEQIMDRLNELSKKEDKTDAEKQEFSQLTGELDKVKTKSKIDMLAQERDKYKNEYSRSEERMKELERQIEEIKGKKEPETSPINKETVNVGDKAFYTDKALRSLIDNGKISEDEAVSHQQQRIKAEASEEAFQRLKQEQKKEEETKKIKEDTEFVFNKYPKWYVKHPEHDPNDPLYKKANQYFKSGMNIRASMEEAEEFFKGRNISQDRSDDLSVFSPTPPDKGGKGKEYVLTDDDKEVAVKMYRDVKNPDTGRLYTEQEAIEKYKKSMAKYGRKK